MKSLDPRVNRMNVPEKWDDELAKVNMDQLITFEVFVQTKESRPYQHEGIVHAPDEEMAFIFAKEQYSRRSTCSGIKIVKTQNVFVSELTENDQSVYDTIESVPHSGETSETSETYEIYHLLKRGKQHKMAGTVEAASPEEAIHIASEQLKPDKPVFNVWIIKTSDILTVSDDNKVIWETLPEKTFREAMAYRGADKIKKFREDQGPPK